MYVVPVAARLVRVLMRMDSCGILRNGNKGYLQYGYENGNTFPWEMVLLNKNTGKPAVDLSYVKGLYAERDNGYILANDEGVWLMNDVWDGEANDGRGANIYSQVFRLTDEKGNFVSEQPGDVSVQKFCTSDDCRRKTDQDPWFKKPISANTTGFAALSTDKKTVYFHREGVTTDLLAKDPNKASIAQIYSFNLEEEQLIYNAKKTDGKFIVVSIDLESGTATKHALESQVESMMGMWMDE